MVLSAGTGVAPLLNPLLGLLPRTIFARARPSLHLHKTDMAKIPPAIGVAGDITPLPYNSQVLRSGNGTLSRLFMPRCPLPTSPRCSRSPGSEPTRMKTDIQGGYYSQILLLHTHESTAPLMGSFLCCRGLPVSDARLLHPSICPGLLLSSHGDSVRSRNLHIGPSGGRAGRAAQVSQGDSKPEFWRRLPVGGMRGLPVSLHAVHRARVIQVMDAVCFACIQGS